jgi:SpoVK/Ycf46/Vps4 family AAA+-type ATPase
MPHTGAALLHEQLRRMPLEPTFTGEPPELRALAQQFAWQTHGFTGADLICVCQRAALFALQRYESMKGNEVQTHHVIEDLAKVSVEDLRNALLQVQPSVSPEMLAHLERWRDAQGSGC